MTQREILSEMRRLVGNPDVTTTSDRDLIPYLASAADWFVAETKNLYRTDTTALLLVADQQEYALTDDIGWILFCEWDDKRLTPSSHHTWDRQGTDYRAAASGNPSEFAVYDRFLILHPPPSSTAVTTDSYLTIRSIVTAGPLTAGGFRGIADFDLRLVLYEAAYEYLALHPSEQSGAMAQFCLGQIQRLLPAAKERAALPIEDHRPRFYIPNTRQGAAR